MPFFTALEKEISKAKMGGKDVIIEMDANSKLGSTYVENDPNEMSANGKILEGIIKRNGLVVAKLWCNHKKKKHCDKCRAKCN